MKIARRFNFNAGGRAHLDTATRNENPSLTVGALLRRALIALSRERERALGVVVVSRCAPGGSDVEIQSPAGDD
jgi:hypothetical protein